MKNYYPVLLARPVKSKDGLRWHAWCPFCRKFHMHAPAPGHRVAHCHNGNFGDGYILKLDPAWKGRRRP